MRSNESRNWARQNEPRRGSRPEDRFPPASPGTPPVLETKADKAVNVIPGIGLDGGGDLSTDVNLSVDLSEVLIQGAGCTITDNGDGTFTISVP